MTPVASIKSIALRAPRAEGKSPYISVRAELSIEGQLSEVSAVIGCSTEQRRSGLADRQAQACGFADLADLIARHTETAGLTVPLAWEDASEACPAGAWRIVTAGRSIPADEFRALLA